MVKNPVSVLVRLFSVVIMLFMIALPVQADGDEDKIKAVIEDQLNAFAADNGEQAYSHAAPIVKNVFPSADMFMAMVKKGYTPVYRNTERVYGKTFADGLGRPAMRVVLTGADGKRYEAIYSMEQQPDGSWKIAGCVLVVISAQEV
jgi:Domain of unknown function (DUF4864)